ncbi:hypothetical protein EJ110_NYTH00508 [Nymphaea thermarum]|nr:hypothetical protein EJ110_NYTH00508 [Nymphaea thermarum]
MVRSMPAGVDDLRAAPLAIGLFISVCALVALCAKHRRTRPAKQVVSNSNSHEVKPMETKMMMTPPRSPLRVGRKAVPYEPWDEPELKFAPRSPLASPKALLATVSNKALPIFHAKKAAEQDKAKAGARAPSEDEEADGVWKRAILMGERCQPPDFSGAIYYDERGKRLPKFPPKSPRGSSPLANFTFPVVVTRESSS